MLAIQLKNWLETIDNDANILVYVAKTNETRQLLFSDIDINQDGNVVIDVDYDVPVKKTINFWT